MSLWEYGFRLAGIVGVEPWRFSLRQLVWMYEGRLESQWNHTSHLLAASYNIPPAISGLLGTRGKERSAKEFVPKQIADRQKWNEDAPRMNIDILKKLMPMEPKHARPSHNQQRPQ